jgi:murein L,D-transpeptidase YcbB/YkuD
MNCVRARIYTLLFAVALLAVSLTACRERIDARANPALQALVQGKKLEAIVAAPVMTSAERRLLAEQIRTFYQGVNYQLVWVRGEGPSRRYRELSEVLASAPAEGLPPDLYSPPQDVSAEEDERKIDEAQAPEFDIRSTAAFFRYFSHVSTGRLDPRAFERQWTLRPKKPDLVSALTEAVRTGKIAEAAERLQPTHPKYRELRTALARYRTIAGKGGWPTISGIRRLKPGDRSAAVPLVRQRLAIEGELDASLENDPSPVFDPALSDAVKRFQERHRLKPDGVLDRETIATMNVPVETRIRAIELNMERWRWLPDPMPDRYLIVNVPDYRLEAIEHGKPVLDMRVVVGAPDNKTPIFAEEMTHVIFSPYWNVPPGILREETAPRALLDPGFLSRNNMEVVDRSGRVISPHSVDWSNPEGYRVRQRPGKGNALGGVKFMFPNNFDVYLHDTNAERLFQRIERGLSHGCVRVEEPEALAAYVLRDQPEWTAGDISAAMQTGREKHVALKSKIPVFIVYNTAWSHGGGVRFLKDLYGHDAAQSASLWR